MSKIDTIKDNLGTWELIAVEYKDKYGLDILPSIQIALFDGVRRDLAIDQIEQKRGAVRQDKEEKAAEPATQKQLAYIIDLDGDPHWSGTKQEAMKYIDELKKK
ncbi:MAG: hypothetical protein ABID09_03415 [Candidatus Omnitrophota bacterium]